MGAFVSVFFVVGVIYFGIPSWWLFNLQPYSVIQVGVMKDRINPIDPTQLGQRETITVLASNNSAIADANVTVVYDGHVDLNFATNSSGQGTFTYLGEPTIIKVDAAGYTSINDVVPHAPEPWVQEKNTTYLVGSLSALGSFSAAFVSLYGLMSNRKTPQSVRRRKKPQINTKRK